MRLCNNFSFQKSIDDKNHRTFFAPTANELKDSFKSLTRWTPELNKVDCQLERAKYVVI